MSKFAGMNKGALRNAMREAGLSYAGLNNAGMVEALEAHAGLSAAQAHDEDAGFDAAAETAPELQEDPAADLAAGADLANYIPSASTVELPAPALQETNTSIPTPEVQESAAEVAPAVQPRNTSKGVKIEKERPTANGVKMPSAGTLCRAVWDELQRAVDAGTPHTVKTIKEFAPSQGWNVNNAAIEFYNWRKFKGISGRSK